MSQRVPEILYKYRNFDARAISMQANDQVYLASPVEFNDPFDCLASVGRAHGPTFSILSHQNPTG